MSPNNDTVLELARVEASNCDIKETSSISFPILQDFALALELDDGAKEFGRLLEQSLDDSIFGASEIADSLKKARIAFESAGCANYSRQYLVNSFEDSKLREVTERMTEIAVLPQLNSTSFLEFWELDCEFHRQLAVYGGLGNCEKVVNAIQIALETDGKPLARPEMRKTCEDHLEILDAIAAGDLDRIYIAVEKHIVVAFQKWIDRRRTKMLDFIDNSPALTADCIRTIKCIEEAAGSPAPEFVKDGVRWDSFFASKFEDEYVVFKFVNDEVSGVKREFRKVLFHSADEEAAWEFAQEQVTIEDRPFVRTMYYPKKTD